MTGIVLQRENLDTNSEDNVRTQKKIVIYKSSEEARNISFSPDPQKEPI